MGDVAEYEYTPLSQPDRIRLLQLLPGGGEQQAIACKILEYYHQHDASAAPYVAISYCWESEEKPASITVDGRRMSVTQNLYNLLVSLRDRVLPRFLWVDAVSLNQADSKEKEAQIPRMAEIYAKAERVLVWLGEAYDEGDLALAAIEQAGQNTTPGSNSESKDGSRFKFGYNYRYDSHIGHFESGDGDHHEVKGLMGAHGAELQEHGRLEVSELLGSPNRTQDSVSKLLQRQWFRRIWVMQEIAAARQITLRCGQIEIEGNEFCSGLPTLQVSYEQSVSAIAHLIGRPAVRLSRLNLRFGNFQKIAPLTELTDMYRCQEATVEHDKIYALLGLCSDEPQKLKEARLGPDYSLSPKTLLLKVTSYLFGLNAHIDPIVDTRLAIIDADIWLLGSILNVVDEPIHSRILISAHLTHSPITFHIPSCAKRPRESDYICRLRGRINASIIRAQGRHFEVLVLEVPSTKLQRPAMRFRQYDQLAGQPDSRLVTVKLAWGWWSSVSEGVSNASTFLPLPDFDPGLDMESSEKLQSIMTVLDTNWSLAWLQRSSENNYTIASEVFQQYASVTGLDLRRWDEDRGSTLSLYPLSQPKKDATAFGWAISAGCEELVSFLIAADGKGVHYARDNNMESPLHLAAKHGRGAILEMLLKSGNEDVNATSCYKGETALHWAASEGHVDLAQTLLQYGADLGAKSEFEKTPLHWACDYGHPAMVEFLLKATTESVGVEPTVLIRILSTLRQNHAKGPIPFNGRAVNPRVLDVLEQALRELQLDPCVYAE